jgi:hypothetical protein
MEWETEAAYLASLPRTTPYRVPEHYFQRFNKVELISLFL